MPSVPLPNLAALLAEAGLVDALPPDCPASLAELQNVRLMHGRAALLVRLKGLGMISLRDRQKFVQIFGKASRQGRIVTRIEPPLMLKSANSKKKIAFCFLIYDAIHHEELWYAFFSAAPRGLAQYSVHVHAKSRTHPLRFFEDCHLPRERIVPTEYSSISIVHAMNMLLAQALDDEDNEKFVFLSGACVPIKPFEYVYGKLLSNDDCYFSEMGGASPTNTPFMYEQAFGDKVARYVEKASQWCVLNRSLARICAHAPPEYKRCFEALPAPDEYYFLTSARLHARTVTFNVAANDNTGCHTGPTFANWWPKLEIEAPGGFAANEFTLPKTYRSITIDELHSHVHGPCLFARKFSASCQASLEPLRQLHQSDCCMHQNVQDELDTCMV